MEGGLSCHFLIIILLIIVIGLVFLNKEEAKEATRMRDDRESALFHRSSDRSPVPVGGRGEPARNVCDIVAAGGIKGK